MALHGISDDIRNEYRAESEQILTEETKLKDVRIPLSRFQNQGLAIGKDNKTKVKR